MLKDKIQAPWISKDHCVFFAGLSGGFDIRSCPHPVEKARLIAAAPDLLDALQSAVDEAVADDLDGWYANAKAAILKATGGAS